MRLISIKFDGKGGTSARRDAESIGLIVPELVINSLKHAFKDTTKGGAITVSYDVSGTDWQLAVSRQRHRQTRWRICPTQNWTWYGRCQSVGKAA